MGSITETATAFPGQTGQRPNSVAPLAEMLRLNGFATAAFGKSHETAAWEVSTSGPTNRWPTRSGFDEFYGFIGGEANQWAPTIYHGMDQVEPPNVPNYHFLTDMTDQAIDWAKAVKSLTPDKPFFIYYAPGATHAPHHVPKEWIARYKGRFDQGWDKLREETLARQKTLGVVPPETGLAPKPAAIKDWDTLHARRAEALRPSDGGVRRLRRVRRPRGRPAGPGHRSRWGRLDNTLVFYILGDNGASAEGGMNGLFNEMTYFNGVHENVADILTHYDDLGGPFSYGHYAAGWAVAGDTPFTWTKQVAANYGGTRNGMVVHWPRRIKARGEVRSQWHHVIDIAPTILEATSLPEPKAVNGTPQTPIEGVSLVYTFDDPRTSSRHATQYFEIFGNRAIYHDGWLAGTVHRLPWEPKPRATLQDDVWELYDTRTDFSLANDLGTRNPEKLKEMQDLFMREAVKNHVLPIDDRSLERMNAAMVGRPDLMAGRTSLTVYQGMTGMTENVFINLKNRSHTITAEVDIPQVDADGVILCQAGRFGGWSLFLKGGKPTYTYNFLGLQRYTVAATEAVPTGKATIRFEFVYDGGRPGSGGTGTILVDGKKAAEGRIDHTQGFAFSADEGADVGRDSGTPVTDDYKERDNAFTGRIHKVTVELK